MRGRLPRRKPRNQKGQGISEYAAILAFTAGVIAMVYMFVPGQLSVALSQAFSTVTSEMDRLTGSVDGGASS